MDLKGCAHNSDGAAAAAATVTTPAAVSATLAVEAFRARLVAFFNFVDDASAGRAQLPTDASALQAVLVRETPSARR